MNREVVESKSCHGWGSRLLSVLDRWSDAALRVLDRVMGYDPEQRF